MSVGELDSCFHLTQRHDSSDFTISKMGLFICPRTQKTFWCLIPTISIGVRRIPTSVGPGLCLLNLLSQTEMIQLPLRLGKLISPIATNNVLHMHCQQSLQ